MTRCLMARDMSVNCHNATELVDKVMKYTSDLIVFIATNEPADSPQMTVLKNAGFLVFNDVWDKAEQEKRQLDKIAPFVIETALMMDADTFLGWGLSEVNDMVEMERMKVRKAACVAQNYSEIILPYYRTWCFVINYRKLNTKYDTIAENHVFHPRLYNPKHKFKELFDLRGPSDPGTLSYKKEEPAWLFDPNATKAFNLSLHQLGMGVTVSL